MTRHRPSSLSEPAAVRHTINPLPVLLLAAILAPTGTPPARAQTGSPSPGTAATDPPLAAFEGGVSQGEATGAPLALSLDQAIARGLQHNLGLLLAETGQDLAQGRRWQALSALLPAVAGHVTRDRETLNLAAFGLPVPAGESPLVGPFDLVDARLTLEQSLYDRSARERHRSARAGARAATADARDARDLVVLVVTRLYLGVNADRARVEAAQAQVETARALATLAHDQVAAGTAAEIDDLRARVELETRRQEAIVATNDLEKDKLALARAIGLPLGQALELTDDVPFTPATTPATTPAASPAKPPSLEQALAEANARRSDLAAASARVDATRALLSAAHGERLPSLSLHADWGAIGPTFGSALDTYDVGAVVSVPLFLGGRVHGDVLSAQAQVRQAEDRLDDLRGRVELEVRSALLDLDAAQHRVTAATSARDLADRQLVQARDRFRAGVSDSLEVVQAQQAVAASHDRYIASLYAYNLAKVSLARAMGVAEERTLDLLEGNR